MEEAIECALCMGEFDEAEEPFVAPCCSASARDQLLVVSLPRCNFEREVGRAPLRHPVIAIGSPRSACLV